MRIDIMLPFYGDVSQFRSAVESVRAQSVTDFRLVCVDDAYPSLAPGEWLRSLGDERITYVRNTENLGVAGNFNQCLSLVESDWFVMMGGDDIMLPHYLASVTATVERYPDSAVIQPSVEVIDQDGRLVLPLADRVKRWVSPRLEDGSAILSGDAMAESLARADWAYFPSLLWRTSTARVHGFDERFEIALDLALLFDVALAGGSMVVTDDVCFRYRRHHASASSVTAVDGLRFEQERELLDLYADRFAALGWTRAARVARHRIISRLNATTVSMTALLRGQPRQAAELLRYALS